MPGGRPHGATNKDKPYRAALVRALRLADSDPEQLDAIAAAHLANCRGGDMQAIKELADRLDGKVPQAHTGDDEADPITVRTIITGVPRAGDE